MQIIYRLLGDILATYLDIAPYLLIGLTFAGLLHVIFKKDFIARQLGKSDFLSVLKASLLGVPLPLCSCGVIPTALYLRKQKASQGATLSFLISTPQTGVDSIIATYGMMGPIFAVFRPVAAFIMGIVGGVASNLLVRDQELEKTREDNTFHCSSCEINIPHEHSLWQKLVSGARYAFLEFLDDISPQLLFGVILAGIISFAIPDNFFLKYGGEGIAGMLLMMVFAIPLYVCATASIPIAVSLLLKGLSPGAAFVFLVAGPATNAATIALIARALGRKVVFIYLSVIAIFALLGGFALNYVFLLFGRTTADLSHHLHGSSSHFFLILTAVFSVLFALSLFRKISGKFRKKQQHSPILSSGPIVKFRIEGMTCNHCVQHVSQAIGEVQGVTGVDVNLNDKTAVVSGDFEPQDIVAAVDKAGYKADY